MINKKEELAELIVKNIVFISLFAIFCFYSISLIIVPKIVDFQDKRNAFKQQQYYEIKLKEENAQIRNHISESQKNNHKSLASLETKTDEAKIQVIAQDFFSSVTVEKVKTQTTDSFLQTHFKIKGTSNGSKAIFDFIDKIKETMPNASFILPLNIQKEDPLTNSLKIELFLKIYRLTKNASRD
ncbi:hypothetical protein [Helicobacter kayseriensis]|uniref:hypothetical protein n=1 Tax=Helicobacter kayseriensis TaxID=2905877 RepID=UPI001E59AB23|nr:hypothetical protein [Helicobacter kayseriensis]MCE3047231.1 hypothetical protein [Helicobacter kayseriensis]MCE3048602.1 hypothetical protein [Helicobacter kayseriensis]